MSAILFFEFLRAQAQKVSCIVTKWWQFADDQAIDSISDVPVSNEKYLITIIGLGVFPSDFSRGLDAPSTATC